jgi:internalin A
VTLNGTQLILAQEWLEKLTSLKTLYLNSNKLKTLPEWLGNLTTLTSVYLNGNELEALPQSFGNLTSLATLNLRGNNLTKLPHSIERLTALTTLDLEGNSLSSLPESLENLTGLTTLYAGSNGLRALPGSLGNLRQLSLLDVRQNHLETLPRQLADSLARGLQLRIEHNPLKDPLPKLVQRGGDALAVYLRSLDEASPQYEAKILLVGEGNVGKTSLVAALKGDPFVEGRPTTHGIEISPLVLQHPDLKRLAMTLRAWDFGGQEVYRVTHQFFFSSRALYLVVWNAREGQEQNDVEDWLSRIRLRAGRGARAIVVATHCAERLPELDYPELEQAFPEMLAGSFDVDNRTGAGIPMLRAAISQQAPELPQMGQLVSPRWVTARDEILGKAQTEPQISYEQFMDICIRHGVIGQEVVTLAQLMHDLGQVIYYGEDEGLKDIVVLNPEWLTKAISYVLEDKPTRDAGGVLDHARLREIWQDRKEGQAYPARYHPYFLRLMEKFDVSYRLEGDELHSMVAQLVPHQRPELPWKARTPAPEGNRSLALICRLSETAPGLIPWLTVRHHRASTGMHWRRGIFLRHPISAYASEALLELNRPDELSLEVRAPSPDLYFNVLRDSLEDLIIHRWPGLTYQLLIPCPGTILDGSMCPGQFPLEGLLRLREGGLASVPCMECAEVHEISLLITGFTVPGQTLGAELEQMHDQIARIESGIVRVEGQAAEIAESVRRVLRVASIEVTDCPSLFTLTPETPAGGKRLRVYQHHYRLTLWCEHPGYWHPWSPASYELDPPKEWFAQVAPYVSLIFKTLQLLVPPAGPVAGALLPPDRLAGAQNYVELMSALIENLPPKVDAESGRLGRGITISKLTSAEGQALRAIRTIIFEHDRLREFGGLRRVQAPSGDFMWVCAEHYPEYDPGLPTIPYPVLQ